ncbi:hypothetical protein KXV80_005977, partial [Aspergillus fumigatus]
YYRNTTNTRLKNHRHPHLVVYHYICRDLLVQPRRLPGGQTLPLLCLLLLGNARYHRNVAPS